MRLGGGTITFPFFSQRHVAVILLDKTELCIRFGGGSITFSCFSKRHIEGVLPDEQKLCTQCHASARLRGGIIIPFPF